MKTRILLLAILAASASAALLPRRATVAAAAPSPVQVPGLSPRGLFLAFVAEATGGFQTWQPRCEVIPGACGAGPFLHAIVVPDTSVWFNPAAAAYVRLIEATKGQPRTISFPNGSVIARPIWAIVKRGADLKPGDSLNLPVYSPSAVQFSPHNPGGSELWNFPHPAIDVGAAPCSPAQAAASRIPLGCFFHFNVTTATISRFQTDMLNVNEGDMAVLLGFHLIVKQGNQWRWATFWWQAQASSGAQYPCGANGQLCAGLPSAWSRYVMAKVVLPSNPAAIVPPAMNPYIEGSTKNNANLNCAVCHSFAAQPMDPSVRSSESLGAQGPSTLAQWSSSSAAYLAQRTPTDNVWSISEFLSGSRSMHE